MKRNPLLWLTIAVVILAAVCVLDCSAQCSSGSSGTGGAAAPFGVRPELSFRPAPQPAMEITSLSGSCAGGSCGSSSLSAAGWNPAPRADGRTPIVKPSPLQAPPSQPSSPPATKPEVDVAKLADAILDKLASDPRFKGPQGEPGPAGQQGPPGEVGPVGPAGPRGEDATVDTDAIVAAVMTKIDYAKIASLVNVAPPPTSASERHFVLVADQGASYWPRLVGELRLAQEAYYGIDVTQPPAGYAGPVPTLVEYTNSIPRVVAEGQDAVSKSLILLSRGTSNL